MEEQESNRPFVLSADVIIKKFTGHELTDFDKMRQEGKLLLRTALMMTSVEWDLLRSAQEMQQLADKINSNITANPGDSIIPLQESGEVGNGAIGRIDGLIIRRQNFIDEMEMLVHLLTGRGESDGGTVAEAA